MRNAFVGHTYHRTNLLSQWFIETLRKNASLEEFWLDEDGHASSLAHLIHNGFV
jgi:hypothetical protein